MPKAPYIWEMGFADFQPLTITAPGARLRAAHFAPMGERRGTVMLLTGQSEFIEKYGEVIDDLCRRGFAVAAMDWRGQGGSQRPLPDPMKIYVDDFSEYDGDVAALLEAVVRPMLAPGERPIAMAHSMGGHILLRTLATMPDAFAAAVITAPMVEIRMPVPSFVLRWLAASMARRRAKFFAWGIEGRDPLKLPFEKQIVTSDPVRYGRTQALLAAHPALRVGGPTWGWLAAATRAIATLPGLAKKITLPVLICDVGDDLVCNSKASVRFAARLPRGTHMMVAGSRHEILMERDVYRDQFWAAFDSFLKEKHPGA